ncbi:MAG: FIST N-terminal domain-containing protein [Thermodesulfobacteriota bacterium]
MVCKKSAVNYLKIIIPIITIAVIFVGIYLFPFFKNERQKFKLVPKERMIEVAGEVSGTEVGTGWSSKETPEQAVKEATEMALASVRNKTPDFAIVFASSGNDMDVILYKLRKQFSNKTKIYGGTSDSRAVMTDKGFVKATKRGYTYSLTEWKRGLAIMTISSKDIVFGVGSADLSVYPSIKEASKAAILNAIKSVGRSRNDRPKVILLTPTVGIEEEIIEGIEEIVGPNTPILGGTAGGPQFGVFGENKIYAKGVSLAVIYTHLPMGWTFEGGFDVKDPHTGIVTKVDGQTIIEIDNKPALDVYDEWLSGEIKKLHKEVGKLDVIRDLLLLHPIYRKYKSSSGENYFLFSHPWSEDETLKDKSIKTSTKIKARERIYLSHGTWETVLNRIAKLPRNAKICGGIGVDERPIFGIGYICGGIMGVIPETEREKISLLMNYANNNAPFIANFTWGEQGYFPGISNKHGNLLTSFLVIGKKGQR